MKIKILPFILSTTALVLLVAFPDRYLSVSVEGLSVYINNVLPALLPFMFFSKLLTSTGVVGLFQKIFQKPCKILYNTSGASGYVFCMSILSGYPIGAKLLSDEYKCGRLNYREIKTALAFTSTSGPMFILGTVGVMMLNDKKCGAIILVCHYLSAILNGLIYKRKKSSAETLTTPFYKPLYDNDNSIYDTVMSVLACGAYVAIFYMVAVMLNDLGILKLISNVLNLALNNEALSDGLAFGIVEMTGGCIKLANVNSFFAIPSICAVISFGGLSITLQSLTFLKSCGIKTSRYLLSKITQSAIAFIISCFAVAFFL